MKNCLISTLLSIIANSTVIAGTSCQQTIPRPDLYQAASQKTLEVHNKLKRLNPQVVLIARVGSDLGKYGLHYTHMGFAVKDYPGKPGRWTIVHLLNNCGTAQSTIYKQGLFNFFMDNLYSLDYQITVPDPALQSQLYQTLTSTTQFKRMHGKEYSMIAYPYSHKYQNSNQWVLEVLASSMSSQGLTSRGAVQNYLQKTGYRPAVIKTDPLSKLGASLFTTHIKFDDHPRQEMRLNQFSTVSVASVINYLRLRKNIVILRA